jgi:hypothetical protein
MRFIVLIEASHCVAEPPAAQAHIAIDVEENHDRSFIVASLAATRQSIE